MESKLLYQYSFTELKKALKKDYDGLAVVKIAFLSDSSTQLLVQAIKGLGFYHQINFQVWEADFNQVELQVFSAHSELYLFEPDIVIIFQSTHKLLEKYNKSGTDNYGSFADKQLLLIKELHDNIVSKLNSKIIFYNFPEIDDAVFGNFANKASFSFLFQIRKLNYQLMLFCADTDHFFICDLASIQHYLGKAAVFNPSIYVNTDMVLAIDVLPQVAKRTIDIIKSVRGNFIKCVVLDLDNTIWGGVIGDDGIEKIQMGNLGIGKAFTEFQLWLKKLKNRGIILAVCSKNNEETAKEPFLHHGDMVLAIEDIAVFIANWDNKVNNMHLIRETLNIGFDSMVFLDDSPFERNMVRENIPSMIVPELPGDPAYYLDYLYQLNLFEASSFSEQDFERTDMIRVDIERNKFKNIYGDDSSFLENLEMVSLVEPFTHFNIPRVAQLTQRSNQFNLRTVRYSPSEIAHIAESDAYYDFSFSLEDKFGNYGLVAVVILKIDNATTLFIDTWLMSCRILKRGMENFVLNTICQFARDKGFSFLRGEYLPTPKNEMVKEHYANLLFEKTEDGWILDINHSIPYDSFIRPKN